MKIPFPIHLAAMACLTLPALAEVSTPLLLGVPTPASDAVPVAERLALQGLTPDGRWVLLTATSDRRLANDLNSALDTFLLDRTTGQRTGISAGPSGRFQSTTASAFRASAESGMRQSSTNAAWVREHTGNGLVVSSARSLVCGHEPA